MTKLNSLSKLALVVSAVAAFSIGCNNNPPATTSTSSSGGSSSGGTTSGGSSSGGSSSGGTTGTSTGGAALTLTPNTQAFGSVAEGASSPASSFTVKNAGTAASGTVSVTITGSADFVQTNTCGAALAVNATCTVSVTFSPSTSGNEAATLTATATPGGSASASLSGAGLAAGGVTVSPSTYPFGSVTTGQVSTAQTFTFTNTGAVATGTPSVVLFGGDSTQFQLGTSTCGTAITAGATCTVSVTFNPTSAGSFSSSVQLTATPGAPNGVSAAITGTGVSAARITSSPLTGAFGTQIEGNTSSPVTFTITNQGGVTTAALTDAISGTNAADFVITTDGCAGQTLNPLGSCQLLVTFAPSTTTGETAKLTVTDSATDTAVVNLTGSGASATGLSIAPSPATFSSTIGTASASQPFTVTNAAGSATTGTLKLTFGGANPGDFAIVAGSDGCSGTTLASAATCTVSVTFTPTSATEAATLNVTGTPGGTASATLNGTGIAGASLSSTPPSLAFGSVATGTTSASKSVTVSNSGGVATGTPTVTLGGANAADFTMTNGCTAPLAAGTGTCKITVTFTPTTTTNESGQITVVASPGGTLNIALTGTGITPSSLNFATGSITSDTFEAYPTDPDYTQGPDTFTIINNGTQATGALTIAIGSGAYHGDFVIAAPQGGDCVSGTTSLATSQSCTIRVSFTPLAADLTNDAVFMAQTLNITPTSGSPLTASLSGYGANVLGYQSSVNFADDGPPLQTAFSSPLGVQTTQYYYFYNQDCDDYDQYECYNGALNIGTVSLTGDTTDFTIVNDGCSNYNGFYWYYGSCVVGVAFDPTTVQTSYSASLTITGSVYVDSPTTSATADTFKLTGSISSPLTVDDSYCTGTNPPCSAAVTSYSFDTEANAGQPTIIGKSSLSSTLTINCAGGINCGLIEASLDDQGDFAVVTNGAAGNTAFQGSANLVIAFEPKTTGIITGHLSLTGAAGDKTILTLTGTGANASSGTTGNLAVSPATFAYGSQNVGTSTATQTFTVTNNVGSEITLQQPEVVTSAPAVDPNFTISYPSSAASCFTGAGSTGYATLAAGATCQLQVAFTPVSTTAPVNLGVEISDNLQVTYVGGASTGVTAAVTGTPTTPLTISLTSGTDPMQESVGATAISETFTIKNNGSATGSLTTTYAYASTSGATVLSNPGTTDTCNGNSLAAAGTCTVTVSLLTTNAGVGVETFTVEQGSSGVYVASPKINGTVLSAAALSISPTPFDFGSQAVGSSTPVEVFTVTNNGGTATGTLTVSASATEFVISANSCTGTLAAGATCQFSGAFDPPASPNFGYAGDFTASDGTVSGQTAVNGRGVAAGGTTISPAWFDFTTVIQSPTNAGATTTFTVHNGGTGTDTLNSATGMINGTEFAVVTGTGAGTCVPGGSLAAGGTCTVVVQENITAANTLTEELTPSSSATTYAALNGIVTAEALLAPAAAANKVISFPNTAVGATSSKTVHVTNNGVASATLGTATITGLNAGLFSITADTCSGTSLPGTAALPAGSNECAITVTFTPSTEGTFGNATTTLAIIGTDSAGNASTAIWTTITGTGVEPAALAITPADAGFVFGSTFSIGVDGGIIPGDDYADNGYGSVLTYTVTNSGGVFTAPLSPSLPVGIDVAHPPAGTLFYVDEANSTCYGDGVLNTNGDGFGFVGGDAGLAPNGTTGDSCTLVVDMHAALSTAPGFYQSSFTVDSSSGNSNAANVFGAVGGPILSQSSSTGLPGKGTLTSPYDLGTVSVGSASTTSLVVVIQNNSQAYTTGLLETSLSDQTDFSITADTCAGNPIGTAATSTNCSITVLFNPASNAVSAQTITVTDTATGGAGAITFYIEGNP